MGFKSAQLPIESAICPFAHAQRIRVNNKEPVSGGCDSFQRRQRIPFDPIWRSFSRLCRVSLPNRPEENGCCRSAWPRLASSASLWQSIEPKGAATQVENVAIGGDLGFEILHNRIKPLLSLFFHFQKTRFSHDAKMLGDVVLGHTQPFGDFIHVQGFLEQRRKMRNRVSSPNAFGAPIQSLPVMASAYSRLRRTSKPPVGNPLSNSGEWTSMRSWLCTSRNHSPTTGQQFCAPHLPFRFLMSPTMRC